MATDERAHVFGIRHHGPGSARSLLRALEVLQPDLVLVEGPPDAAPVLSLAAHPEMRPPVSLLVYAADTPRQAVHYPFAELSPEWQALRFALARGIEVRFIDLPQAHRLALEMPPAPPEAGPTNAEAPPESAVDEPPAVEEAEEIRDDVLDPARAVRRDPIGWLARAAGYSDGERWWDLAVEQRRDGEELFAAVREGMTALREAVEADYPPSTPEEQEHALMEARREAWMRQSLRAALREGFQRIAVVCGAWHVPALQPGLPVKSDAELLKGLPKVKVAATWVPWTHGRLCYASGYGAGIESPGWYLHLWRHPERTAVRWLTHVARLLRGEDLDASSAHVIEAVRLAETLAALRGRPNAGLAELNEAAQAVLCFGDLLPMQLVHRKLIVGETLGEVPEETPSVPLQQDLQREQRRLRLKPEAGERTLDLDLRRELDLGRSHLLHRLELLGVPWGRPERAYGKSGTFHELWRLRWDPDLSVALIEAGVWGNTLADAASARARDAADRAADLAGLTSLLDRALLAELPEAVTYLMERIRERSAVGADTAQLMSALPPLARVLRYGSARRTDAEAVREVVDGLVVRICIGLPAACASLNDEAAGEMLQRLAAVHESLSILDRPEHLEPWHEALARLASQQGIHGLLAGRCCRLLLDAGRFTREEVARRLGLGLSTAVDPTQGAAWVEGLLAGSGLLLLHDEALWEVVDSWVTRLREDAFVPLLPLLRRTFSTFDPAERRQIGERVRSGARHRPRAGAAGVEEARADLVLPIVRQLLGLPQPA
ncbi:MAG: DUF5682 family protein [Armatimonadota bacterium]